MAEQLTDAYVRVNSELVGVVPGSIRYTPGFGDRRILAQAEGGGRVSQLMATDQSTAFAKVNFSLYVTVENEKRVRAWQANRNRNTIEISVTDDEGNKLARAFTQAAVMGEPEVRFSVDGQIDVEWNANQSV